MSSRVSSTGGSSAIIGNKNREAHIQTFSRSGDDHDYCDYRHPNGVREVTLKAFSMAMGIRRPGFQLLSLIPPPTDPNLLNLPHRTHADMPCFLPDQIKIYTARYLPLGILTLLVLCWINFRNAVHRHGGWKAGFAQAGGKVARTLSPNLSRSPSATNLQAERTAKRGELVVPLTLPSRRSSSNLHMSPANIEKTISTGSRSRPPSLAPIRRITKSAPVSPLGSPRSEALIMEEDDTSGGNSPASEALYFGQTPRPRQTSYANTLAPTEDGRPLVSEPQSYFQSMPDESPSHAGTPMGSMRRPQANRRVSRMSDWQAAAKAKDKTVMALVFDSAPVSRWKRWIGRDQLIVLGRALGGRHGVLARSAKDALSVAWPTLLVFLVLNVAFFYQ